MTLRLSALRLLVVVGVLIVFTTPARAAVTVTLTPRSASLRPAQSQTFTATVSGTTDVRLTWTVNGVAGGNSTLGAITTAGRYTAPAVLPGASVTVRATSVADPTKYASATVSLLNPVPVLTDVQPRSPNNGLATTLRAFGSNFVSGAQIYWGTLALPTTFVSTTELRASYSPPEAVGSGIPIHVRNPSPGAANSGSQTVTVYPPIIVVIGPPTGTLTAGMSFPFASYIVYAQDATLQWTVNGIAGGNSTVGTIDASGVYTAPSALPSPNVVTIRAASVQDPRATSSASITLWNALPVVTGTAPAPLTTATTNFTITGTGFARNATVTLDGQPVAATVVSSNQINVTGATVSPQIGGLAFIKVINPDPGGSSSPLIGVPVTVSPAVLSYASASRFLEQASWGPTPASVAHVMQIGRDAWISEQFAATASTYNDSIGTMPGLSGLQSQFMRNAVHGNDQLRQRMAFALGQLFVVSGLKVGTHAQMAPYQRLLLASALGNFRTLLRDITLSPAMGEFLDMVNNDKPNLAYPIAPNENFARELMQLFTIGPGSYTEADVKQLALVMTGWTYPPATTSTWPNPRNYSGQMVPFEGHHDTSAKTLLGVAIPAGQTADQDLNAALDIIFNHPNVPQFVSYRLIQRLVTGNPSAAYVSRVAAVFANNGMGVRGDLKAVVRAILLDPEAATDDISTLAGDQGHLREPVLYVLTLLRGLGATLPADTAVANFPMYMGQNLFYPPSVFNYFSPSYRVPGTDIPGPEFQILNGAPVLSRANFAIYATHGFLNDFASIPLDRFDELGGNIPQLLDAISNTLYRGQMQADMRTSITNAISGFSDPFTRSRTALFLAASHARYQVQR